MPKLTAGPHTSGKHIANLLKGKQGKEACWHDNVENMQIFPSACSAWLYYEYLCIRSTFLLQIWTPEGALFSRFIFYKAEKAGSWRIWYFCHTRWPCLWCHWHRPLDKKLVWCASWLIQPDLHVAVCYLTPLRLLSQPCLWHHRYKLLGTKWRHSWSHFREFHMLIFNKQDEKLLCVCF